MLPDQRLVDLLVSHHAWVLNAVWEKKPSGRIVGRVETIIMGFGTTKHYEGGPPVQTIGEVHLRVGDDIEVVQIIEGLLRLVDMGSTWRYKAGKFTPVLTDESR